jgi:hypothetical protein
MNWKCRYLFVQKKKDIDLSFFPQEAPNGPLLFGSTYICGDLNFQCTYQTHSSMTLFVVHLKCI